MDWERRRAFLIYIDKYTKISTMGADFYDNYFKITKRLFGWIFGFFLIWASVMVFSGWDTLSYYLSDKLRTDFFRNLFDAAQTFELKIFINIVSAFVLSIITTLFFCFKLSDTVSVEGEKNKMTLDIAEEFMRTFFLFSIYIIVILAAVVFVRSKFYN